MRLVFDIETNGLLYKRQVNNMTNIWCICAYDLDTSRWYVGSVQDGKIPYVVEKLQEADLIIGHNIIQYDIPAIKQLYPNFKPKKVEDTMVMSQLFRSDRKGGHKLEAWGWFFKIPKKPDLDWAFFSPEMLDRCTTDVEITTKLYEYQLTGRAKWDWDAAIRLEYGINARQADQEKQGILLDQTKAYALLAKLDAEIEELSVELLKVLPLRAEAIGNPLIDVFKKNGDPKKIVTDHFGEDDPVIDTIKGDFTRIQWVQYNLNSDTQIKQYLLSQAGWKPTEWNTKQINGRTVKTSPILTEDSYGSIKGSIGKDIARRNVLTHRRRTVKNEKNDNKGWLNLLRRDGRLQAEAIPTGTPTARYRHKIVVNVPKAKKKIIYGYEMRDLFVAGDGYVLVGCDAAQLEARIEAHYCYPYPGGKEYAHELMDGDIHANNAKIFGTDRDGAKSPKYALTYGCRWPKIKEILGCSDAKAKRLWNDFWKGNTSLNALREDLERSLKKNKGFVRGLDGRKIWIRSPHKLVNSIIQSAGSICVKAATVYTFWKCEQEGIKAHLVLHQHDEWQAEVCPDDVPRYKEIVLESFRWAGKHYNLNVPLEGDVKLGFSWAETH